MDLWVESVVLLDSARDPTPALKSCFEGVVVTRCNYRTPMDEAVARARAAANERGQVVRLHFGGKELRPCAGTVAQGARICGAQQLGRAPMGHLVSREPCAFGLRAPFDRDGRC